MRETMQPESLLALHVSVGRALARSKSLTDAASGVLGLLCPAIGWDAGEVWSADPSEHVMHRVVRWPATTPNTSTESKLRVEPAKQRLERRPLRGLSPNWPAAARFASSPVTQSDTQFAEVFRLPMEVHGVERAHLRMFARRAFALEPGVVELMDSVGKQFARFLELAHQAQRVAELEDRRRAVFETSFDAIITVNAGGRVVEFSPTAQALFGYGREEIVGRSWDLQMIPERSRARARAEFAIFCHTGRLAWSGKHFSAVARDSGGREFPVEFAASPTHVDGALALTICVRDASARLQSEQELSLYEARLRSLMADLLVTEERERKQIAYDLHDGLSQTLAVARMKLAAICGTADKTMKAVLGELEGLMLEADRAVRAVSFELSPPVLHHLGLEPAVEWLVENVRTRYELEIALEDDGQPKTLDEKPRVIAFRAIRELLINAAKHSQAEHVDVRLRRVGHELCAMVEDDGVGMDARAALERGSGLFSIKERLNHVGGSLQLDSKPKQGAQIRLFLPLPTHEDAHVRS